MLSCYFCLRYTKLKMEFSKTEYRANIKLLSLQGKSCNIIYKELKQVMGVHAPSLSTVKYWKKKFTNGESNVQDKQRSGRPRTGQSESNISKVKAVLEKDNRLTINDCAKKVKLSATITWHIITGCLGFVLRCARWVPKLLDSAQKKA